MDKKTYNSNVLDEPLKIIAPYYNAINPTIVFFEQENIYVSVNSLGHIEFLDENEKSIGFVDFPYCDGESDRWTRYTSRWFQIVLDCNSKKISVLDKTV